MFINKAISLSETSLLSPKERELLDAALRTCCSQYAPASSAVTSMRQPSSTVAPPSRAALERSLCAAVIGQDHVAREVAETLAIRQVGLDLRPCRPCGVFLFTGPTGVGKTEFARCLSSVLAGRDDRLLRLDCSEYGESHQVARLVGAPPSYIGYGAPSPLEDFLRGSGPGVLLFDEFEKADAALHQLCLQIFDAGRLTTSAGRTLDFSRLTVIATTNVQGARSGHMGFAGSEPILPSPPAPPLAALGRVFAPELLNRFDRIIAFRPIGPETVRRILRERLLPELTERLGSTRGIRIQLDAAAEDLVVDRGYSDAFGARHLQRTFASLVLLPLAEALAQGAKRHRTFRLTADRGDIHVAEIEPSGENE